VQYLTYLEENKVPAVGRAQAARTLKQANPAGTWLAINAGLQPKWLSMPGPSSFFAAE